MKAEEIRNLTSDEIDVKIQDAKKKLFNLRFQAKTGKLEKSSEIRALRKDVARMNTIKTEQENK